MTKRKLYTAGLVGLSLFLIAAKKENSPNRYLFLPAPQSDTTGLQPPPEKSLLLTAEVSFHTFDTAGLCSCLDSLSEDEWRQAPKVQLNARASAFVSGYVKKYNRYLAKIKDRSNRYFSVMDSVFRQQGLPTELKYLAVVESELKNTARSRVGAVGLWQLMPSTACTLGLKVRPKYDERMFTARSTQAAAKYLNTLHNMFDDWLLTVAAYNSGPAPVYRAIRKSGSRNFWKLQTYLPVETRGHVKRFIATHYYFEGKSSLTVLTKSETEAHVNAVAQFLKKREKAKEEVKVVVAMPVR